MYSTNWKIDWIDWYLWLDLSQNRYSSSTTRFWCSQSSLVARWGRFCRREDNSQDSSTMLTSDIVAATITHIHRPSGCLLSLSFPLFPLDLEAILFAILFYAVFGWLTIANKPLNWEIQFKPLITTERGSLLSVSIPWSSPLSPDYSFLPSSIVISLPPATLRDHIYHARELTLPSLSRLPSEPRARNGCVFFQFKILSLNFLRVTAASGDFYGSDRIGRRGSHCSYAGAVREVPILSLVYFHFHLFFPAPSCSIPPPFSLSASHYFGTLALLFFLIALSRCEGNCAGRTTVPSWRYRDRRCPSWQQVVFVPLR